MAKIERKTKRYPTDLTDEEWSRIEPLLPACGKTGRSRSVDLRDILDAIRCMARSGGGWRMLPKDFPPWQTVHRWFRCFVRRLLFRTIHDVALMIDRERSGLGASPTEHFLSYLFSMSAVGTKRKWPDVRLESVTRSRADMKNNLKAARHRHDP